MAKQQKMTFKKKREFNNKGICWKCQIRPIVPRDHLCEECRRGEKQ